VTLYYFTMLRIYSPIFPAVALPMQSIMTEKDSSEPVTKRHLSFDELLVHIKHYSPGTRKGGDVDDSLKLQR
jgi:hypothetical protein